jgi:hypothetical protein
VYLRVSVRWLIIRSAVIAGTEEPMGCSNHASFACERVPVVPPTLHVTMAALFRLKKLIVFCYSLLQSVASAASAASVLCFVNVCRYSGEASETCFVLMEQVT